MVDIDLVTVRWTSPVQYLNITTKHMPASDALQFHTPSNSISVIAYLQGLIYTIGDPEHRQLLRRTIANFEQYERDMSQEDFDLGEACEALSQALYYSSLSSGNDRFMLEAIDLVRQSLALRPLGHPGHDQTCENLTYLLHKRYEITSEEHLLIEAIGLIQKTISLRAPGHSRRAVSCELLADLLWEKYQRSRDDSILEDIIALRRDALSSCTCPSFLHPNHRFKLASSILQLFKITARDEFLLEAIELMQGILAVEGQERQLYALASIWLMTYLFRRYDGTRDNCHLVEAIQMGRNVLDFFPLGDPHHCDLCGLQVDLLEIGYHKTSDSGLLVDAVELCRNVLQYHPPGHADHSRFVSKMANLLRRYCGTTGSDASIIDTNNAQRDAFLGCSPNHPDYKRQDARLRDLLQWRYSKGTSDSDINHRREAVDFLRDSFRRYPHGHPDRQICGQVLARGLSMLLDTDTAGDTILREAIASEQELISELSPENDSEDYTKSCDRLYWLLLRSYVAMHDEQALEEAADLERRRSDLASPGLGSDDPLILESSLALRLCLYHQSRDDQHLLEATGLARTLLGSHIPQGDPGRATVLTILANLLEGFHDASGDQDALHEALLLRRESKSLVASDHPHHIRSLTKLASALAKSYESTGDGMLIKELVAIQHSLKLSLLPPSGPNRASACDRLADTFFKHYKRTNNSSSLIEVISLRRELNNTYHQAHSCRAKSCRDLATALLHRYEITGDHRLLDEIMGLCKEAHSLCPPGHPDYGSSCEWLAYSQMWFSQATGDDQLLISATRLLRKSLSLQPPDGPYSHIIRLNLAAFLCTHYIHTKDDRVLDECIDLVQTSLLALAPNHPERAHFCTNLATLLSHRYRKASHHHILDEIYDLSEQGRALHTPGEKWQAEWRLAWVHLQLCGSKYFDIALASHFLFKALAYHPTNISGAILTIGPQLESFWRLAEQGHLMPHSNLVPVYQRLIELLPFLSNSALETHSQLWRLRPTMIIGSDAFVNATLAQDWKSGLEALETTQGVFWSQRLYFRDPQLQNVPPPLANELNSCLRAVGQSSAPLLKDPADIDVMIPLTVRDIQHNRIARIHELLREIRALPGMDRFMLGETHGTLCSAASDHPVVLIVGARGHVYALLLTPNPTDHETFPLDWNPKEYYDIAITGREAHSDCTGGDGTKPEGDTDRAAMIRKGIPQTPQTRRMRYLWFIFAKPVLDRLKIRPTQGRARPRLHWCLTGAFRALPLHAAGIYDGPENLHVCCSDYVVSSYTPTLATLLNVQKAAAHLPKETMSLTLVAEKRAFESHLHLLHQVDVEIANVAAVANANHIQNVREITDSTTVDNICAAMQGAHIVHLACHGVQDRGDATQSGFCLGDGRLTISKLMELKMDSAFLAFLSACETAKGDADQPDQLMHLAAAILFTGCKTVIATMWAIRDADGPQVAKWFYEELFAAETIDANAVAYALDIAVTKLRQSGASVERWAPFIHMGA